MTTECAKAFRNVCRGNRIQRRTQPTSFNGFLLTPRLKAIKLTNLVAVKDGGRVDPRSNT